MVHETRQVPYDGLLRAFRYLTLLAFLGCGVDTATHAALEQRVDLLQRRLDAVETAQARAREQALPGPDAIATAIPRELEAPSTVKPNAPPVLRIGLGKAGVTVDGLAVSSDALDATLRSHAARSDLTGVILDAEEDIAYATVIALMDRIRESGLDRVALATRGGTRPEPEE